VQIRSFMIKCSTATNMCSEKSVFHTESSYHKVNALLCMVSFRYLDNIPEA